MPAFFDSIKKMKEIGVKQNLVSVDSEVFNVLVEKSFSVVIGSINEISPNDLITATSSLATLIKNEYFPPTDFKFELGNVVNIALLQNTKSRDDAK